MSKASQASRVVRSKSAPHYLRSAGHTLFRSLTLVAVVAMLFGGLVALPERAVAASGSTTSNLNMRSGPSTNYGVILVIPRGAAVTIDGDPRGGFYPVSYGGRSGYASADYISMGGSSNSSNNGSPSATGSATVTSSLNLRGGPSTGDRVLAVMRSGASVTLNGRQSNGFLSVTFQGTSGWAFAQYLRQGAAPANNNGNSGSVPVGNSVVGSRTVTTGLNLRTGPSTSYGVILVMRSGATVELMGNASGGFLPVRYQGTKGWASADYLSSGGTSTDGGSNAGSNDIVSIIYAAADRYGQPRADMLRVARCESNLNPRARNASSGASGLFQFIPSTWQSTPYRDQNIFDPWASANAAGWMWANGRRNEWSCQ
jgi:uncharacterized protein YraI